MLNDIFSHVIDALLAIPGIRFVLGLVDNRLRPVWVALLLAGTVYLLSRASHYFSLRRARDTLLLDGDASTKAPPDGGAEGTAILENFSEAPTETATMKRRGIPNLPPQYAQPVLVISLGVAVVALGAAFVLFRSNNAPRNLTVAAQTSTADTAFRFEDAGWRKQGSDCIATMRVTAMGRAPRRVSLYVSGNTGVIGRADVAAPSMAPGALMEFRLTKVNCDLVKQWEVQGEFAKN